MIENRKHYQQVLDETNYALFASANRQYSGSKERDADLLGSRNSINAHSINHLLDGTTFSLSKKKQIKLPDVSSMMALLRTQVEAYASFNHIFCADSKEETDLYYNAWCLSGLCQRAHIEVDEKIHNKKDFQTIKNRRKKEEQEIKGIRESILCNPFVEQLPQETIDKIKKNINKRWPSWEWKIVENKYEKLSIKEVLLNTGINKKIFEEIYNLLSWYSHPNYLSIIQLKDMYKDESYQDFSRLVMNQSGIFLGLFIYDFFIFFSDRKDIFNNLPNEYKDFVLRTNSYIRGL